MSRKNFKAIFYKLKIEDFASDGRCISHENGKTIFFSNGIPGEQVDVEVKNRREKYPEGEIVKHYFLSNKRIQPACKHFEICGGCQWMHIEYREQLIFKQIYLQKLYDKNNFQINVPPLVPSPSQFFYRSKLDFAFSDTRCFFQNEGIVSDSKERQALGFHPYGKKNKVLDAGGCLMQDDTTEKIRASVKQFTSENNYSYFNYKTNSGIIKRLIVRRSLTGHLMVLAGFTCNDSEKINALLNFLMEKFPEITCLGALIYNPADWFENPELILHKQKNIYFEQINNFKFRISPGSFSQPNLLQAAQLYECVLDFAELKGHEHVYDFYCGAGTISCHLAAKANKVTGLELSSSAIEDAVFNANHNEIFNVDFICCDIGKTLSSDFFINNGKPDIIILDPPRSGIWQETIKNMISAGPEKIIYVSCNPVTQVNDVSRFLPHYRIIKTQAFDMFPQTHHIENVILLQKR